MAKICLCLTAKTIKRNLEILNKYRKFADIAELRVDCLEPDERLYIRRFPELANIPVILTIRRDVDGGYFTGGEGARVKLMASGMAYASADSRLNFAYVDIEDDFNVPSLEEAARTFGTKIIRSFHNMSGIIDNIPEKIKSMQRSGDEIIKVALAAKSTADVLKVFQASQTFSNQNKILICMGHYGSCSRILAERFGSFLTYSSALSESEIAAAPGQVDVRELAELYRFREITKKTRIYGIVGNPLKYSVSPWLFNTLFDLENADAVYVPFPSNSINDFLELAKGLDVKGLAVTVPYKESVLPGLVASSNGVQSIGACNVLYRHAGGWSGDNTDCLGFSASLLEFLKRKNLKHKKITIIGAGGISRAVASEIHRLGGKALVLNRTVYKARNIASQYNFRWGGLDNQGIEMMSKYNDIIIQTSSAGMEEHETADPLELYTFSGKEAVMDLIYTTAETKFLKRAAAAGCKTINGYDMVIRQLRMQYANFFKKEIPEKILLQINTLGVNTWNKMRSA
ncbi:MAG: type I 3-dehydroquinate dehydratase [Treponema sp.]|jgi:3-dehydroquinate dehydratase/shikimate dehydrogenase|nr:type I 3-dehydroquinate dehydratase [Treponema sp.]